MRRLLAMIAIVTSCRAESMLGTWQMLASASTFQGDTRPRSLTVRIEPHVKGEVLTFERVEADGRTIVSSTILYFDGAARSIHDIGCSGTQSSSRLENQAVQILRKCDNGAWIKLVRRPGVDKQELILDITEQHADGRHFTRRLVLTKQATLSAAEK